MADNPIKVKAYGKILSFPAGTAPEAIESALAEHEHVLNPDYKAPQPEALDYAKGFASGANKLVSGAGFLIEAVGAKETGKAVRAFGDRGAKYWNDKMSKGGKLASQSQVFVDDDSEDSITGIKLSDDWGKALLMGASESLPSMFAAAIPGVAVTKGIQALAKLGLAGGAGATIPLLAGTAAPVGVTSNIIARVPSAVGFGAAEGVTAGAMNAADFKTSIEGMTDEELNKSPVYRALKEEHDPTTARSLLAEQAALDLFGKTAVSTGTIGALTGGGALSQAYQKVTTGAQSGILGTMLKGAGSEALQETPQSGGEKFIENLTTQKFLNPEQSTTEGVLAAAASGGAIGAFTGGVVGAGGAINITPDRRAQVLNEKRKIAEMKADAVNARTMGESAAEIGAAQDIDQALAAATRATTKPVVSANEVLRSEDPTLADIEKLTGLKPTEAIDTAIDEIENPIINQPQETEDVSNQETQQAPTTQASVLGKTSELVLPDGASLPVQWEVVDADNVKASLKEGVNQPRDRTRAASDVQIKSIANNPDYRRLSDSPVMDVGSPVISHDGAIVAGNGRFEGVSQAHSQNTGGTYLESLKADLVNKGINPALVEGIKKPILVRRITKPFDTRKLALASNSGASLQYSGLELAKIDADRMAGIEGIDIADNGDIPLTVSNIEKIKKSLTNYTPSEMASLVDDAGNLSQDGVKRVRGAILAKAYGNSPTLGRLIESTDNDIRNVLGALTRSAGDVAKVREEIKKGVIPKEVDVTENLLQAVEVLSQIRGKGQSLDQYLAQEDIFDGGLDSDSAEVLKFLHDNIRSQKRMAEFVKDVFGQIARIDQSAEDIFGDNSAPTKKELLNDAKRKSEGQQTGQQQGLFVKGSGRPDTKDSKTEADNAKSSEKQTKPSFSVEGLTDKSPVMNEETFKAKGIAEPYSAYLKAHPNKAEAIKADIKHVENKLVQGLQGTGKFDGKTNHAYATPFREFYKVNAESLGIMPSELYERLPLKFKGSQDTGEVLKQGGKTPTIKVKGVGRPTVNSEGKPIPNPEKFYEWFGDSKVVDKKGRPLVVYRGDAKGKTSFGAASKGLRLPGNIFFTDSAYIGGQYARGRELYSTHLLLRNPYTVNARGNGWSEVPAPTEIKEEWGNPDKTIQIDELASWARDKGFDGLVVRNVIDQYGDGTQYVVFDPTQVKSAIGNSGEFDPNDPNILKQSTFYSALEKEIGNLKKIANKNGEVSVDQAKAWINSRQKEGKFKQAEVEAVGLMDWLDTIEDKVPVKDVENFVRENGVRVEEVILEGEGESKVDDEQVYDEAYQGFIENYDEPDDRVYDDAILDTAREMLRDHSDERWGLLDLNGEDEVEDWLEGGEVDAGLITEMLKNKSYPEEILGEDTYNEIRADAEQSDWENQQDYYMDMARERLGADNTTGGAEFQDYVLHGGGEGYKELLMTLPDSKAKFNAPHFDRAQGAGAENIFAHTRINEREMDVELTPEQVAEKEAYDAWEAGNNTPEISKLLEERREAARIYRLESEAWKERMAADTSISEAEYNRRIGEIGTNPPEDLKPYIDKLDAINAKVKALQAERLAVKPKEPSTSGAKERVLFVEEIQSDWAQKGRDEGFKQPETPEEKEYLDLLDKYRQKGLTSEEQSRVAELRAANVIGQLQAKDGNIPTAPFVTDTKAWTALVVKRLLRYAAENGFDRIAWTTGAQQAERYRLSKFVESIKATRDEEGKYRITAINDSGNSVIDDIYEENKLAGTIGKELAEKIIKQPDGEQVYEGLDLDVGGQGMREFYDRIVPSVVNDVAKKLGGGKVEIVSMGGQAGRVVKGLGGKILITYPNGSYLKNRNTGAMTESQDRADGFESVEEATKFLDRYEAQNLDEPGRQMSLRITPAMKDKVMQGLPLFQRDRAGFNPRTFTISLMDGSDLSSVIHEGGHFYLEALAEMASQPNAPEQIVNDFDTTLQWFGIGEQAQGATDAATRAQGYPTAAGEPVATFRKADDIKSHPRYAEAKAGDIKAAFDLVSDLVTEENLNEATMRFAGATFVPVSMIDKDGANRLPTALAYHYANAAGGSVSDSIFESRKAYHTGMNAMERLVSRANFSGKVEPGRKYVLVDDVTTVGSTLADLASYIQENGGEVIGSVLLANATRSGNMFANVKTLKRLEEQYGNEIRELFSIEPSALTQEEAQYLIGFRNADELRSSAVKAQGSRLARIHARKISKGQSSVDRQRLRDIWQSMSLEQKRPYHEQWAQSFERYALEGKAPSKEMQSVFDRFQEWMLDVYKSLKEFLKQNPLAGKLNDEVRGVFDRLLATEQDIAKSREAPTKERSLKNGERAKQLERKLREQGYDFTITAKDVRDFAAGDRGKEIEANTAEKIAGIFGRKIVWIDAQGDYDINGVVVPSIKDTIFIDVNTDKAAHAVMGHELSHHLEHDNPDVYDDLLDALSTVIKDHQGYAKKYGIEGARKDDITKEIVGDIMGDNFTRPEFWNRVAGANPSTFKSIADSIIKWLKNLILKAKSRGLGSDQWVTDSQKAQDILAKAIAKYEGLNDSVAEGGAKFHKVWHGSPHDHSKFDSTKIGTGEGAQAYGYGHYFADRKEVAEFYKENVKDMVRVREINAELSDLSKIMNKYETSYRKYSDPKGYEAAKRYDELMAERDGERTKLGKLYEVELAPEQEDYLLWDKPLSEQSEKVKKALLEIDIPLTDSESFKSQNEVLGPLGMEVFKKGVVNQAKGNDVYVVLSSKIGGARRASEYLHSLGIRGIKYLDGTSRSKGEGAYNYVVFDDKDIEITAKFSKKAAENTLIVQHNLTVKNLLHADRLGGLAAPSIAVTDKSHPLTGFGEITLLAEKDLIDPQKGAKIFGSDIYSPRYPQLSYDFTGKPIEKLKEMLADGIAKMGDSGFYNDSLQDDPFRELLHNSAAMYQFLTEQGKKPKIVYVKPKPLSDPDLKPFLTFKGDSFDLSKDEKFRAEVKNIYEVKNEYKLDADELSNMSRSYAEEVMRHRDAKKNTGKVDRQATNSSLFRQISGAKLMNRFENYLAEVINKAEPKERIFQGYTYSGTRRYLPHDIDTVIKLLKKNLRGGENFKSGLGSVRAHYSKQFKSIEQIRNSKNSLMSSEDFDAVKKEVNAELDTLSEALNKYGTFSGFDNVENMLYDAAKLGINRALKENGFENVPDRLKIDAQNFLNKLKDMPTEYFEAKLLRRVDLGEFTAAVVPKDTPAQALEILKKNGITDIRKYKPGDNGDRIAQIGKLDRVMFSFAGKESETADIRSLETAQTRIGAGDNAEAVRRETGWFKGVDDKWRYEINDKDASLKKPFNKKTGTWYSVLTPVPMSRWTLGNVLDHPSLYAAYPMLKDVRINLTRTGRGGQFKPRDNMINIGGAEKMEDVKSILLHEIQHGIQNLEDFARGGSPSKFKAKPEPTGEFKEGLTALLDLDRLSKQFGKTHKEVLETGAINEPFASTFLNKTEADLDYLIKQAKNRILTPYEKYQRLAGEVESRNVESRLEMDEDERRSIPPSISQDTPDSDVVVTFNGKDMESAPPPANAEPFDPNTDIPETLPRKSQRLIQDAFNRFTVIQNWLKEKGVTLSEKADVYQAEERYHSLVANQLEDFREQKRNPLIEKIAKAGFTMADVSDFLEAQHAAEANAAIQKISNNDTDTAYGITDKEAADYLAKADPKLAKLANELRDITEESKQMRLKAGLLSQDEVDAWESTYEHYIPVKGDADAKGGTGKGLKVNFKTKRRLGHGRRDESVIENIFLDHERAIMQVEKNRVAKHLVMMAAEMQMPEIMTVGQPVKRKTLRNTTAYEVKVSGVTRSVFNNKQAADMFKQLLPDLDKGVSPNDVTVEQTKDQRIVAMASPMLAENEINAYIDGHAIRVQINDDLLARAYAKLGVTGFSALVSAGRAFNGYLSKVYTGYNPEFILTNMIRDFTSGLINLTGEEGIKMAAKTSGNYVKSFSSLMRYAVSNGKKSDKWIDMYRANGGNTGAAYLSDLERLGDEVKTEYAAYQGVMANLKSGSFANATRAAGRKVFNLTLKWIYNLNQAGENAMRLAAFRAMVESGKTPAQAAKVAKNITVNFNRKGELGAEANAAYLFFNASVQGVAALAHAHFKGEHKYQAWGLSSMVGVLGYMAAAALLGGDDDEYDKMNDYTKSRNLLIKAGEGYAQIPIPYGYGFFWNMGRSIAEAQHKGELGNLPWHIAASAIEELTPFSDTVVGTQDGFHFDQVMLGLLPTVIKIPAQPAFNKQLFSGSELMPDSAFQQFQPDREKLWRATQGTMYDRMSGWLDEAIGADVSPETLKHYTRTFTGGAGAMVDTTVSAAMLKKEGAELEPSEIPFVRKAYSKLTIREHRAAYYKAREEAKKTAEEFTRAKARNDVTTINKLVKDEAEMIGLDAYANKLSKAISAMRDMQDAIRLDDNLNAAEKRTKIKELEITEQKFYDQYLDVFKIEKAKMKERQKD